MHVCYIGCQYISDTIVRGCVAVLYWKHDILYDILTYLNQWQSREGLGGRASLCVLFLSYL